MDKNIIAALIIGTAILLHPVITDSYKLYQWNILDDGTRSSYGTYFSQSSCVDAKVKRIMAGKKNESCIRFLR